MNIFILDNQLMKVGVAEWKVMLVMFFQLRIIGYILIVLIQNPDTVWIVS